MRYCVCFPFPLIYSHVALSNRYCKFFCSDFILAISGSIVYHESNHNSLITSFSRPASEPELSELESSGFGAVNFLSKLYSDTSTLYFTWEGTERFFCSCDMVLRMTTTDWISQEIGIIYIADSHYSKNNWIVMPDPFMNKWIVPQAFVSNLHLFHALYSDRVVKDTFNIPLWIDWKSFDIKFLADSVIYSYYHHHVANITKKTFCSYPSAVRGGYIEKWFRWNNYVAESRRFWLR